MITLITYTNKKCTYKNRLSPYFEHDLKSHNTLILYIDNLISTIKTIKHKIGVQKQNYPTHNELKQYLVRPGGGRHPIGHSVILSGYKFEFV